MSWRRPSPIYTCHCDLQFARRLQCWIPGLFWRPILPVPEPPQSEGDGKNPAPLPRRPSFLRLKLPAVRRVPAAVLLRFAIWRANNKIPSSESVPIWNVLV